MNVDSLPSDSSLLDLLRRGNRMSIGELAEALEVTATAVRQRLNRLMGQGLVQRSVVRAGRGRPSHAYELTALGRRQSGSNFTDLALVLWQELREVKDVEVRRGLLDRLCRRLADRYAGQVRGNSTGERLASLAELFQGRRIPVEVEERGGLPVLNALACPYPDLAEQDRSICALERMLFSELAGESLRLSECRLDGDPCCRFELAGSG